MIEINTPINKALIALPEDIVVAEFNKETNKTNIYFKDTKLLLSFEGDHLGLIKESLVWRHEQ